MTLSDGSTIEIPMPSRDGTDPHAVDGYRVRGVEGVTEFSTLNEVVAHVLDRRDGLG